MSRKAILSLATATMIAAGLAATAADARGFGGGSGGSRVASVRSLGGGNHLAGRGNVGRLATLNRVAADAAATPAMAGSMLIITTAYSATASGSMSTDTPGLRGVRSSRRLVRAPA